MMRRLRGRQGFTLVEVVIGLAISTLVASGVAAILVQFLTIPDQSVTTLTLEQNLRQLTTWVRLDANKAQSFDQGVDPVYGTFYWLDYSTYPPTRRDVVYFWNDGVVYRQTEEEGVDGAPIVVANHIASYNDVSFSLSSRPHPENADSILLYLNVGATATADATSLDGITVTDNVSADFRPESINAARYSYYFLHNNPTPPTANTTSQSLLSMTTTAPTATTLYNYDTNRDSTAGLSIASTQKGGDFSESNSSKFQVWATPTFTDTATIDGRVSLFVGLAAPNFQSNNLVILDAYLYDYDVATSTSTLIIKEGVTSINSTNGWIQTAAHFRPTAFTVLPGHQLRVKVEIDGDSQSNGMLAYDTTSFQSMLMVPFVPSGYNFSDVTAGGTTEGTILEFGGLTISVTDLPEPAGFRFSASGPSRGTGIINACDATFLISSGSEFDVTCGSVEANVLAGEVELRLLGPNAFIVGSSADNRVSSANIVLPAGANTVITDVSATGFTMTQTSLSTASVTVDASTDTTSIVLTAPTSSQVRVDLTGTSDVSIAPTADSVNPVTVEVDGQPVIVPPGATLPEGIQGIKELAVQKLDPYRGQSYRIVSAINQITNSLTASWWVGRSSLDTQSGQKVFSREKDAVQQLQEALAEGGLSPTAASVCQDVIQDLVRADRKLATAQLEVSLSTATQNPTRVKQVAKDQADASDAISQGDAESGNGNWDNAVDRYRQAWEDANQALAMENTTAPAPGEGNGGGGSETSAPQTVITDAIGTLTDLGLDSTRVDSAVSSLNDSLSNSFWTDSSTLDPSSGGAFFGNVENAVANLEDSIKKDDLSKDEVSSINGVLDGLAGVAKSLASGQSQRSLALPAVDNSKDQKSIEKDQGGAADEISAGDSDRNDGDYGGALNSYASAWQSATDALTIQGAFDRSDGGGGNGG